MRQTGSSSYPGGFFITDSLIYIALINVNLGDEPEDILGIFKPVGKSIEWQQHVWAMTPERMEKGANPSHAYTGAFNGSLYHLGIYPFVADPTLSQTFDLARAIDKVDMGKYFTKDHEARFWMMDARWSAPEEITAVYSWRGDQVVRVITYSVADDRITRLIKVDLTDLDKESARLMDDGRMLCFDKAKRTLVLFQ